MDCKPQGIASCSGEKRCDAVHVHNMYMCVYGVRFLPYAGFAYLNGSFLPFPVSDVGNCGSERST